MTNSTHIIKHTQAWISNFIIQHNICPFAKREFEKESIHYEVVISEKLENQLQELLYSCEQLERETEIETSLLIVPNGLSDFDDYLDFLELANELMHQQGYEGIYQLASFHPDYCFDGVDAGDASNFTNRSPYPMLHLIREVSLEKALESYPEPEKIPARNIEHTQEMGTQKLEKILEDCCKK
jgi:hypothetical protein